MHGSVDTLLSNKKVTGFEKSQIRKTEEKDELV